MYVLLSSSLHHAIRVTLGYVFTTVNYYRGSLELEITGKHTLGTIHSQTGDRRKQVCCQKPTSPVQHPQSANLSFLAFQAADAQGFWLLPVMMFHCIFFLNLAENIARQAHFCSVQQLLSHCWGSQYEMMTTTAAVGWYCTHVSIGGTVPFRFCMITLFSIEIIVSFSAI